MSVTILIVEDEPSILLGLEDGVRSAGYEAVTAQNGEDALERVREAAPDLVLLDLMLPTIDGLEVCQRIRKERVDLPVIMVTAKSQEADKVLGLEMGADDYVTKPFGLQELIARIRAVLRRASREETDSRKDSFGDVDVDFEAFFVTRLGQRQQLSPLESKMLQYFVKHEGRAVSRQEFLKEVWGYERFPNTRTVDFHVLRLRQKIEVDPNQPKHIVTVHGVGYRFHRSPED